MSSDLNLPESTRKEIAFCTLSILNTSKKYAVSKWMVEKIKDEFGTKLGRGNGERTSGFKLSKEQKKEIVESNILYSELALIYDVHESTIVKIKRKAGIIVKRRNHNRSKIEFTDHQLERIKDLSISARQLKDEIGISAEVISRKRTKLGINYREFQKANKKSKVRVKVVKNPLPVVVKKTEMEVVPKTEVKKSAKKDSFISGSKSSYQLYKERQEQAKEVAKKAMMSDADKIKSGLYEWVNILPRGRALKRINNLQN